ncbi:MAG: alanine racemase [Chloroflexi bacterium]|nr:alanine racemase [Chloroflexota bacterium]MBI3339309.1 alanine racemase [Chloroflexota bacterium]
MRPTYLEVNLPRLKRNLENIRTHVAPAKVMAVLKANAYGHGVDGVASFIAPFVDYIGVALVEEGVHLRELGIDKPILVMGATLPEQVPGFIKYNLTLAAASPELLDAAEETARAAQTKFKVHLKIDTGMERIGVHEYEAGPFIEKSLACRHLDIEGIFTHFANSESPDLIHARLQLERFQEVLAIYEKLGAPNPPIRHAANSGAVLNFPESYFDMVRPGVMFYGVYPGRDAQRTVVVRPALTWRSQVAFSKVTRPGRPVSYGSLWQAERPARIVTVPCGYADGYFRRMTNRARVIVNGKKYPQVGRICMDQFMVNLGDDEARIGDEIILLGQAASGERITVEDFAEWSGTNEYEVMTNISARVPRVFVE